MDVAVIISIGFLTIFGIICVIRAIKLEPHIHCMQCFKWHGPLSSSRCPYCKAGMHLLNGINGSYSPGWTARAKKQFKENLNA